MSQSLTSPAFRHEGEIPARYTCEGDDLSPELRWSGVPGGAATLALIVDDPDAPDPRAPRMTWVHWVLYNLPASAAGLAEAVASRDLPAGTLEGLNDWKRTGWGGPCVRAGQGLPGPASAHKAKLETAIDGHVLAKAELIGAYREGQEELPRRTLWPPLRAT